ncbi:MAG: DUF3786 domain-containing protein [Spirochaetes bacterium]|nr:DUF3786 domain-containing protein [Spirochaetota bacterium]
MSSDSHDTLYKMGSPPHGKQNNYETAYNDAAEQLALASIADRAEKSGAGIDGHGGGTALSLSFLGDEVIVAHPEISVLYRDRKEDMPLWAKILILHYLLRAGGAPHSSEQITFNQIKGGMGYYPAFQRRCITPLIDLFGNQPDRFFEAGNAAGGVPVTIGDYALLFHCFPRVEVIFSFWKGDEEFPPAGNVIFDLSISDYLSAEDVAVLCNMIAVKIIRSFTPRV